MPSVPQWPPQPPPLLALLEAEAIVATQAKAILAAGHLETETRELANTLGTVLASEVIADRDQPPFPRVTRDGFAVRAQDLTGDTPLRVVGQIHAGQPVGAAQERTLGAGEAIEIMTGCALPPGADAVLMVEHTQEIPDSAADSVRRLRSILPQPGRTLRAGENVVPQGSEARQGDLLLQPGTRLHPKEIALAASFGLRSLPVYRPPKVAILPTGDELRELPSEMSEGSARTTARIERHQIYDSNGHSLAALVRQAGGVPLRQPPAADRIDHLNTSIQLGLESAPLLLLTGGVSMGRYDRVEEVLSQLGAKFFFTGVKIRPGKPVVFGCVPKTEGRPERFFFGLPGNPVSAMTTFRLFAEPLLAALGGDRTWQPRLALAVLEGEIRAKPGLTQFVPGFLDTGRWNPTVAPIRTQGSGDLAAHAHANCDIVVPENSDTLTAGETVQILLR